MHTYFQWIYASNEWENGDSREDMGMIFLPSFISMGNHPIILVLHTHSGNLHWKMYKGKRDIFTIAVIPKSLRYTHASESCIHITGIQGNVNKIRIRWYASHEYYSALPFACPVWVCIPEFDTQRNGSCPVCMKINSP